MSTRFDEEFRQAVRKACEDLVEDPMASNVIRATDVADHEAVRAASNLTDKGTSSRTGRLLMQADYATQVTQGKYRIHL